MENKSIFNEQNISYSVNTMLTLMNRPGDSGCFSPKGQRPFLWCTNVTIF